MSQPLGMSKHAFARHLTADHGGVVCLTPFVDLRRWSREELVHEHNRLLGVGGSCPLASHPSFRDTIVAKAVGQ